ncbi:MAG TPA: hypothetical protein VK074_13150, partial [Fodinibius sp.]|nr:hypothetical protein [Fodinibius sp.]
MKGINPYLQSKEDIQSIITGISSGMKEQLVAGLSGSARSLLVSIIHESAHKPILLVTHQLVQAQQLYDDLSDFAGEEEIYLYPVNELIASEIAVASPELRSQRIEALSAWSKKQSGILIAPVAALKRMLPPPHYWERYQLPFKLGEEINMNSYIQSLVDMGYERAPMVNAPGEFSMRGGIMDIYPVTEEYPVRIELFDEEVDSIRYFDADSQRSLEKLEAITVDPATELLLTEEDMVTGAERLSDALQESLKKVKTTEAKESLYDTITQDIERLNNLERFSEMHKYTGYLYNNPASLLDYLANQGLIVLDELSRIQETAT